MTITTDLAPSPTATTVPPSCPVNRVLMLVRFDLSPALLAVGNRAGVDDGPAPAAQRPSDLSSIHPRLSALLRERVDQSDGSPASFDAAIYAVERAMAPAPHSRPPALAVEARATRHRETIRLLQFGASSRKRYQVPPTTAEPKDVVKALAQVVADATSEASRASHAISLARLSTMAVISQLTHVAVADAGDSRSLTNLANPTEALRGVLPPSAIDAGVVSALRRLAALATL